MRKKKIKRKESKGKNKDSDSKVNSSFDIREELSISSDEDETNKMIIGNFLYHFP